MGVTSFPVLATGWSGLDGRVTFLAHASAFSAGCSETSHLSVLLDVFGDPVDAWVSANSLVAWVNKDNFVEFESGILTNPIRVQDSKVRASASNTLFTD
mgnify:CR=1 FL=1